MTAMPASASRKKPMICSSVKRFFTSNLRLVGDWTPNRRATQNRGDVGKITEKEAFDRRFEAFISADSSYRDALLDARAALGSHIYGAFLDFGKHITKNVVSVNQYLDQVLSEDFVYTSDEDPILLEFQDTFLISPAHRESDQLATQTMDAREEGEKALLSYLGRKSIRG